MVDQQLLHHAALRLLGHRQRSAGCAPPCRRCRSSCTTPGAWAGPRSAPGTGGRRRPGTAAGARRTGVSDAELLGSADHQRALGDGDLEPVDGDRHAVGRAGDLSAARALARLYCHRADSKVNRVDAAGSNGQPPLRWMLEVLVAEVRDRRLHRRLDRVAKRAERPAGDVAADVEQLVQVGLAAPAVLQVARATGRPSSCPPGTACTCRTTRARRTRPTGAPPGPRRWSRRTAGQSAGAEHRPGRGHRLVVQRDVQVLFGEQRGGGAAWRPELQPVPGPDPAGQAEQLAQRGAERRLVLAGRRDVPGQREDPESLRLLGAERREIAGAVLDDPGHAGDRLHVVDVRRARVQRQRSRGTAASAAAGRVSPPASPAAPSPRRRCRRPPRCARRCPGRSPSRGCCGPQSPPRGPARPRTAACGPRAAPRRGRR